MNKYVYSVAVLILAISIGYYFVIYLPKTNNDKVTQASHQLAFENQQKCSKDGTQYYNEFYDANNDLKMHYIWDTPEFHYNSRLNTCLMHSRYIQLGASSDSPSYQYNQIVDVYSNKTILYGWFTRKNGVEEILSISNGTTNVTSNEYFKQKTALFIE